MAETIPPLSAADVATDLNNSTFAVYLYIGNETDVGWDNAKVAFRLVPRLRIYLVKDSTQVAQWTGNNQPAGVVFGWNDKVFRLLDRAEADDLRIVLKAISDAMDQ